MATHTAQPATADSGSVGHLQLEDRVGLLRAMLLMRGLEERAMSLYRQGKVPGSFYDGFGQEKPSRRARHTRWRPRIGSASCTVTWRRT